MELSQKIGFVAIGRNEGERLKRCLTRLSAGNGRCVYVDSDSDDDSVTYARSLGIAVVELDSDQPFTAARARNQGFEALVRKWPQIDAVMFIDGDCEPAEDFPALAYKHLEDRADVALVTGHCREMFPEKTVYNLMCDIEWRGPVGEIEACGGIFMIRRTAFEAVGRFNPQVIAAEDDDLCIRLRGAGSRLLRIDEEMCAHDADIHHFSQWWRRAVRAGYAFALVGSLHKGYFLRHQLRALIWGGLLPLIIVLGAVFVGGWSLLLISLYLLSFIRTRSGLRASGLDEKAAGIYAYHLGLARFANLVGILNYWRKRLTGRAINIVEYK